ncbi:MAG: DNA-binding response regulator [Acidobacteria bacterium RIFCSPLOWO2_02_FULL_67_36]|nr:MAG: DNA-binding response regulator [Acidobacteria bacterium RIFCSPLOWO2_02_FULL_67_36]OFW18944.1 MAG: DNA-binding response regulator [Acidobacteria bacterium RIFCSPLOWO2_12_FULL_66_21]
MRVLIVEDERRMAAHIARALTQDSFAVDLAHDGETGLELARLHAYDAIVLDIMLPRLDGLSVCRRLRESGRTTPVLVLSARDMVQDRVQGLDAGADDYMVKPFAMEELAARLRALLRRGSDKHSAVLQVGDLTLDPAARQVRYSGRAVTLTPREYALLECFMRRPGVVLTRSMIAEHVWEFGLDQASNVVDVYVKHLRDKLAGDGSAFIQSVRGVGYVFRHPDGAEA